METGPGLKMYSLLKMGIFHCYVSLPECILPGDYLISHLIWIPSWTNQSDQMIATSHEFKHPKWWFSKGHLLISGKSYNLPRINIMTPAFYWGCWVMKWNVNGKILASLLEPALQWGSQKSTWWIISLKFYQGPIGSMWAHVTGIFFYVNGRV